MKQKALLTTLKDLGLSENEAKVYVAALSLKNATILKIAAAADIKRTTVYTLMQTLKSKGLISVEVKGLKQLFVAENPEKLTVVLNTKLERFKQILPELQTLYHLKNEEGTIKYYEGIEALKSVYENILEELKAHDEYLSFGNPPAWFEQDPEFFQKFIERRAELSRKLNVSIRLLLQNTPKAHELKKYEKAYHEEIKILPTHTIFTSNVIIMPRKIIIHQLVPPIQAIVIENRSAVQTQRELFTIIWNTL